ncbi:MAG: hypothetical protein ACRECQ_19970, partial [Burkholderiaceae bacterium]
MDARDTTAFEFETDRARFIGRGRILRTAAALQGKALSNTAGTVLDPIFSARRRVRVGAGSNVRIAFVTLAAESRDAVLASARTLSSFKTCEQVFEEAAEQAADARKKLHIDEKQAERFSRFVAPLLYADAAWRAAPDVIERGSGGSPAWSASGISGDRPIVLLRLTADRGLEQVREILAAQRFWRSKRLAVDVAVLNGAGAHAQTSLDALVAQQRKRFDDSEDSEAGVFALNASEVSDALSDGLATAARIVLEANGRAFDLPAERELPKPHAVPLATSASERAQTVPDERLEFFNGIGGFAHDGREYSITLTGDRCTPMPWINVIANPSFGFIVSAEGGGYTWSINSQQNPLTPWPNDPVSDTPNEVIYLRDDESGQLWSATASPIRVPDAVYTVHHGQGYSRFANEVHGIECELLQYVPADESIKVSRLRVRNRSQRARRLSITAYVEWALAPNGETSAPFVVTSIDPATEALFARNAWRSEFGERIAFIDLAGIQQSCTADRAEFLGQYGTVHAPAALARPEPLPGSVGAGLDPCGALQTQLELAAGVETEVVFLLGDAASIEDAQALVDKYRTADLDEVLHEVRRQWEHLLGVVQVRTPDRGLDILLNRWLLFQA